MDLTQYRLRKAAGKHWIIKCDQREVDYMEPIQINEVGALIWNGIKSGIEEYELAKSLQDRFDIDSNIALSDVRKFIGQLYTKGINELASYLN